MHLTLSPIEYRSLNARQKENFNFQKVSAVLADYGFTTLRLSDDWQGADFLAQHIDGHTVLKIQLKGRLTFAKKYLNKELFITFHSDGAWYLVPHDEGLQQFLAATTMGETASWNTDGAYSFPVLGEHAKKLLEPYRIPA